VCDDFSGDRPIPQKWRQNVVNCRHCKRSLVLFLSQYLLQNMAKHMPAGTRLYVVGWFEGSIEDTAWYATQVCHKKQHLAIKLRTHKVLPESDGTK